MAAKECGLRGLEWVARVDHWGSCWGSESWGGELVARVGWENYIILRLFAERVGNALL